MEKEVVAEEVVAEEVVAEEVVAAKPFRKIIMATNKKPEERKNFLNDHVLPQCEILGQVMKFDDLIMDSIKVMMMGMVSQNVKTLNCDLSVSYETIKKVAKYARKNRIWCSMGSLKVHSFGLKEIPPGDRAMALFKDGCVCLGWLDRTTDSSGVKKYEYWSTHIGQDKVKFTM